MSLAAHVIHFLDIGVTFLSENYTYLLTQEKTVQLNIMQPITLATEKPEDRDSPLFLNTLTEISRIIEHNGYKRFVNNLTEEVYSCQDAGWSGNCPRSNGAVWKPIYYGKSRLF